MVQPEYCIVGTNVLIVPARASASSAGNAMQCQGRHFNACALDTGLFDRLRLERYDAPDIAQMFLYIHLY